jgi:hypothetical protein
MKPSPDAPPRLPQPRTTIGFAVTVPEAQRIHAKAAEAKVSLSEFLRRVVLPVCPPER